MFLINATLREKSGKKNKILRENGILPAILYGEGIKNIALQIQESDFNKAYASAGESSLIKLKISAQDSAFGQDLDKKNNQKQDEEKDSKENSNKISGDKQGKEYEVLIHQIARDPVSGKFIHIDFYKPSTKKKIEAEIPLVFEGESLAIKDFGGILVKEIQTIPVKGLAHKLPREIVVDISKLNTFEDRIYVKDLNLPEEIETLKEQEDIVALIVPPREEEVEEVPIEEGEGAEGEGKGETQTGEEASSEDTGAQKPNENAKE